MIVPEALSEAWLDTVLLHELGEERGMGRQVSRVVGSAVVNNTGMSVRVTLPGTTICGQRDFVFAE